ncbi:MAG: hypothetical protein AB7L09_02810 [Nitrospira sp.]
MPKTLKLYDPKRAGKRKCGDCVGCCLSPSLASPPQKTIGSACPEVCLGKNRGCSIYESRPDGCRTYECHWLFNGFLETGHRPDRIGIIFDDGQIRQAGFWLALGKKLNLPLPPVTAREIWTGAFAKQGHLLKMLATSLVIILVRNPSDPSSKLRVIGPNAEVIDAVWAAIMALSKDGSEVNDE